MPKLDQFESVFRSAQRTPYSYERLDLDEILIITDLDPRSADELTGELKEFLKGIVADDAEWKAVPDDDYADLGALVDLVKAQAPDLIVSYRNLKSDAWKYPYSIGSYVNVLTQATTPPVLLVPNPRNPETSLPSDTDSVMVVADHLTGDHRLVNYGVRFTEAGQTLHLTHIESLGDFELYMHAISRIPEIETDLARSLIGDMLLKEPRDYIESCRDVLVEHGVDLDIVGTVEMGHRVERYEQLVRDHDIDVLVVNTKHAHQLAMDSLAHRLAVQFRDIALLLL